MNDAWWKLIMETAEAELQRQIQQERRKLLKEEFNRKFPHLNLTEKQIAKSQLINEGLIDDVQVEINSRRISQEVQDRVWTRDGGKCVICGGNEKLEFDHIIPFSKGGSNTYRNIQLLCEKCNRRKQNKIGE